MYDGYEPVMYRNSLFQGYRNMELSRITGMMSKLAPRKQEGMVSLAMAQMPIGEIAYVIGDIHGRNDLLLELLDRIVKDEPSKKFRVRHIILLGDYVDRGKMSKEVIETLTDLKLPEFNIVMLDGNHEAAMRNFMEEPVRGKRWLYYGGDATLRSYGIDCTLESITEAQLIKISNDLSKALSATHKEFLYGLVRSYELGDFFFAHAGVNPKRSLKDQTDTDLLWVRNEFLGHEGLYEKIVVHGHSISARPEFKDNRIGIDTGAFYSGDLTCLVLHGNNKEIF
jgi:Calcineurin-like phosphoesterase